ncbi:MULTISPECIES: phosphate signaling complex protein PhoU [unclassified Dehalobacter]|uniref:phosphate signaling complex protein PhoU n=1 Tax=unclassified Dehalobacter TaxID=2635733 RepID=UPI000E6C6FE6|nr:MULTISPECIES: phosphate signaling complex protein PhoU [unclassified Dehalobacter]RJE47519.1 phosphate transport system regulatory protein PhoU [Dehalobacter sp. MCB1]TCX48670.1 phosphate transport system regulatory protein PhoU [Dehalobacter sp. 14DCB1]TCX56282.1 phosphate transport system regulatory protein PhoU [Dehalobacter sp. 12DCB1]
MTRNSFATSLEELSHDVLMMGNLVENVISSAVKSLEERDLKLAEKVLEDDDIVDNFQLEIEDKCLTMLALQQPMAGDLRTIGTALKIVTDLERIADHAVDIAEVTIKLSNEPLVKPLVDIPKMAKMAREMLRDSITAYTNKDLKMAQNLAVKEKEVDRLYQLVYEDLLHLMQKDQKNISQGINLLLVALSIERVADHVTNLGEWTIYLASGKRKDLNDDNPVDMK